MLTVVLVRHHGDSYPLTCVVASKKRVGNAVLRNRAKRRVRALINKHPEFLKRGDLLMVLTTKPVCNAPFKVLEREYCYVMTEVNREWATPRTNTISRWEEFSTNEYY